MQEAPIKSRMALLNATARIVGLGRLTRKTLLEEQLSKLDELRKQLLAKFRTKQVRDSLLELRKYRRPPRAAAQVITSLMVIINEPSCQQWRTQALNGLKFPDHQNHIAQIWMSLAPLLQPSLSEVLQKLDGAEVGPDIEARLKAGRILMEGVRFRSGCMVWLCRP